MSEQDQWFYMQGADRQGPVSFDILKAHSRNKVLKDSTLVWTESFGDDWKRLEEVLGNAPSVKPTSLSENGSIDKEGLQNWYYIERGESKGPVVAKALQSMIESGVIDENTRIWTESFGDDWKTIDQVFTLRNEGQPPLVPDSAIPNVWLFVLISVPVVMALVEAVILESNTSLNADGAEVLSFFLFFIPSTICAIFDQKTVERSGRKDAVAGLFLWILLIVPVYIFLRSKRTGLGWWPGFAWIGAVVASIFVAEMLPRTVYLGAGIPACDSRATMGMIEEIYPEIPINLVSAVVIDVYDVQETSFSEQRAVRECNAIVRNSNGVDTPIEYSISDRGDQFYYEVGFAGF